MPQNVIAVDLGGTNIRVAYFPEDTPHPAVQDKIRTQAAEGPDAVIGRIIDRIEAVAPDDRDSMRIGLGAPGPLNPYTGVVINAPNLPGFVDLPLQQRLEDHFGCPVGVGNDASLAAMGEWRHGAGKGTQHLIYLTISTGIGGGVISHNQVLLGEQGLGAEIGHMIVEPEGPLCSCGHYGHLEAVASGPSIARRARERLDAGEPSLLQDVLGAKGSITAKDIGAALKQGDEFARSVIEESGRLIGRALASVVHIFNPEVIVLGGGVSQIGEPLFEPIERTIREEAIVPEYVSNLRILPAALGDDAGLVGAMVYAQGL